MLHLERRGEERIHLSNPKTKFSHRHNTIEANVEIIDMSFFGALLEIEQLNQIDFVRDNPRDLSLHFTDQDGEFKVECLIFDVNSHEVRLIFKHGSFEVADRLLKFVEYQKSQQLAFELEMA